MADELILDRPDNSMYEAILSLEQKFNEVIEQVNVAGANHNNLVKIVEELTSAVEMSQVEFREGLVLPILPLFSPDWPMLVQCDYFKAYAEMAKTLANTTERYHTILPRYIAHVSTVPPAVSFQGVKL